MAIYETNTFEVGEGSIICPEALRINYLYLPNVYYYWNKSIRREIVHVVKDIAASEEILTTYVKICINYAKREK